jgi:hypothetical protein
VIELESQNHLYAILDKRYRLFSLLLGACISQKACSSVVSGAAKIYFVEKVFLEVEKN